MGSVLGATVGAVEGGIVGGFCAYGAIAARETLGYEVDDELARSVTRGTV